MFFPDQPLGVLSKGIAKIPYLSVFLGAQPKRLSWYQRYTRPHVQAVLGWGERPTAQIAKAYAKRHGLPYIALEDGFLRSYGTGPDFPPLSMVVDDVGIYYDATRPSRLENLLNSDLDLLAGVGEVATHAIGLMLDHHLSKYNAAHADVKTRLRPNDTQRILVVDQTKGDRSVTLGGADEHTFHAMLQAALTENPHATIYVKTHPEVSQGRKGGYLTAVNESERVVLLRTSVNPIELLKCMDKVYVVTSTLGFEALLLNKSVVCFGLPWYSGWGVSDDRQTVARRLKKRSIPELFSAAYIHYTRYLNPYTKTQGSILDVIDWLCAQKAMVERFWSTQTGRVFLYGFRRWKVINVSPFLSLSASGLHRVSSLSQLKEQGLGEGDSIIVWGVQRCDEFDALSRQTGARVLRMEDGFIRSVGLGSDLIPPQSLVLDQQGIYFDARQASDLEHILNGLRLTEAQLEEASDALHYLQEHWITKYNTQKLSSLTWRSEGRKVILVPGQVEGDASLIFGGNGIKTNQALLEAVRHHEPDAYIVYKPHPDVLTGNRRGSLATERISHLVDAIESEASVISCIEACDEVHTMTSLTGFDALLRDKKVVTYGQPFYAGWGLTCDRHLSEVLRSRRQASLSLEELVYGALLYYPMYWDQTLRGFTSARATMEALSRERNELIVSNKFDDVMNVRLLKRQWRKMKVLLSSLKIIKT